MRMTIREEVVGMRDRISVEGWIICGYVQFVGFYVIYLQVLSCTSYHKSPKVRRYVTQFKVRQLRPTLQPANGCAK